MQVPCEAKLEYFQSFGVLYSSDPNDYSVGGWSGEFFDSHNSGNPH